jgi:hypothetical protein
MHSFELGRARSPARMIDTRVFVPIAACVYTEIVSPLLIYVTTAGSTLAARLQSIMMPRVENKIFWPALAAISVILIIRNWSRLTLAPHILCLFAYLALAGASILWAFKPEFSLYRFVLEAAIVISIVLPAQVAVRNADMMRGLFLCFAFASILNVFFVCNQSPIYLEGESIGYPGYFTFKGLLGTVQRSLFCCQFTKCSIPAIGERPGSSSSSGTLTLWSQASPKDRLLLRLLLPFQLDLRKLSERQSAFRRCIAHTNLLRGAAWHICRPHQSHIISHI